MAHPAVWPNRAFLYAIGNTPAVCFTSDLPPEQPADILLLGSGDVRHILYTVYADLASASRKLDFTCCDIEPAVLARNILLFTLLADLPSNNVDKRIERIWNFYYHFFIDDETLDMILDQCRNLVDLSADLDKWNGCKYGKFLRFCTAHALTAIREKWSLYFEITNLPDAEKVSLHKIFRSGITTLSHESKFVTTAYRSAGPLWMKLGDMGGTQFRRYWQTGVTFNDPKKLAAASQINPTFAYSALGRGFALHYGSDPLLPFHLSTALAPLRGSKNRSKPVTISAVVESARSEFRDWSLRFSSRLKGHPLSLRIRFFVGDALAFCRALYHCYLNESIDTGIYTMFWTSSLITFDGGDYAIDGPFPAPLQFDVIDTSNLTDHLGLLNILLASRPLLRRKPSSVLYTDSLLPSNENGTVRDGFFDYMCGDMSTMSILLDIIPISYASNFSTYSTIHEVLTLGLGTSGTQFHEHIAWRIASLSDSAILSDAETDTQLKFDEKELADFLFGVYLKMFSDETTEAALQSKASDWRFKKLNMYYLRFGFAYFLRLVKDRVDVEWSTVMMELDQRIVNDKTLVIGSNNLQDLYCQLHLLGVHSFMPLTTSFIGPVVRKGALSSWKGDVPRVVCVTFLVPKFKFKPVLDVIPEVKYVTFILSIIGRGFHSCFHHYQCYFGDSTVVYPDNDRRQEPTILSTESSQGWDSSSPAIFTFYVPVFLLCNNPSNTEVVISVRPKANIVSKLAPILGPYLALYSAPLLDTKYVHFTRERPGNPREIEKLSSISFKQIVPSDVSLSKFVKVTLDKGRVSTLTGHVDIVNKEAKTALGNKAGIEIKQTSPQGIAIFVGKHRHHIPFPFPIDSTNFKSRVARKSAYIEVDVKLSGPLGKMGVSLKPFPIIKNGIGFSLWNVHYLNLDVLPALDLSDPAPLFFINTHITMCTSDRESALTRAEAEGKVKSTELDTITHVKQSIGHLFLRSCGLKGERYRVFALSEPEDLGIHTIIFVNDVCLDLASHTVILDTCILPLTISLVMRLMEALSKLQNAGQVVIHTSGDEVKMWKHLWPVFAERCRKWSHDKYKCEYLTKGVPVSEGIEQDPLCSCGKGKDLGKFEEDEDWKPFAPYVTRAAISPLFAVPFVETIASGLMDYMSARTKELEDLEVCNKCGGPGKPKLLLCGACRSANYCSAECQRADWKRHKALCKKT